jgi:hypothetical protein
VTFDRDRPIFAAVLGGVALLPLIVPDTFRVEGVVAAWQAAAAVGVAVVVTAINLSTLRWWAKRVTPPEWTMLLAFVLPGILGGLTLSLLRASPPDLYELLYEILFTFGTVVAGGALSVAVGLTFANAELDSRITEINVSALKLSQHSSLAEQRARDQVAALMHGPIYGRLSACAMALNFHAAELQQGGTERTDFIMTTVREYLDAAFRDLELLSTT